MIAAYLRVSTEGQVADGYGLDVQRADVLSYSKRNKLKEIRFYVERGVSGALEDRPTLSDLLIDVYSGEIETVIIPRLDRLARDLLIQESILVDLRSKGAQVVSIAEPDLLKNDPGRVMMRQVLGAFNEYDRKMIAQRLSGGRNLKGKRGGFAGGQRALGYVSDGNGDLKKQVEEVEIVKKIKRLRRLGWSFKKIADELNEEGVSTKRGKTWYAATVRYVVNNPIYRGKYSYNGFSNKRSDLSII